MAPPMPRLGGVRGNPSAGVARPVSHTHLTMATNREVSKTAYELMPSLVGSEMCIRDSGGAVHQPYRMAPPMPRLGCVRGNPSSRVARQRAYHLHRQAFSRTTISPRMRTTQRQTCGQPPDRRVVHRLLARTIGTERLRQKHREGLGRWKQPFPMSRQQRLDLVQQFRPRQQIEERIRIAIASMLANTSLLPHTRTGIRMHLGWLLG